MSGEIAPLNIGLTVTASDAEVMTGVEPHGPIESEKAGALRTLWDLAQNEIVRRLPKDDIVLQLRLLGLKVETARALVTLAERSLTRQDFLRRGIIPPGEETDWVIRRLEAVIAANFERE